MGRAKIVGNLGEGLYRVKVMYDRTRGEKEIAALQAEVVSLEEEITGLLADLTDAEAVYQGLQHVLKAKIDAYIDARDNGPALIKAAQDNLAEVTATYVVITDAEQALIDAARADLAAAQASGDEQAILDAQAALDATIAAAEDPGPYGASKIADAQAALDAVKEQVNGAEKAMRDAQTQRNDMAMETSKLKGKLARAKLTRLSDMQRVQWLQDNLPVDFETDAWCADYNRELTGEVGTLEPGRQASKTPIIYPAGDAGDQAAWSKNRDGQAVPIASMSPAAGLLHTGLIPGTNTWQPVTRKGTITAVDQDASICSVTLDPLTTLGVDVQPVQQLTDIPIVYMSCNGLVFEVGDKVVVYMGGQDNGGAKVIGFVHDPKPCCLPMEITQVVGPMFLQDGNVYQVDGGIKPFDVTIEQGVLTPVGAGKINQQQYLAGDVPPIMTPVADGNYFYPDAKPSVQFYPGSPSGYFQIKITAASKKCDLSANFYALGKSGWWEWIRLERVTNDWVTVVGQPAADGHFESTYQSFDYADNPSMVLTPSGMISVWTPYYYSDWGAYMLIQLGAPIYKIAGDTLIVEVLEWAPIAPIDPNYPDAVHNYQVSDYAQMGASQLDFADLDARYRATQLDLVAWDNFLGGETVVAGFGGSVIGPQSFFPDPVLFQQVVKARYTYKWRTA